MYLLPTSRCQLSVWMCCRTQYIYCTLDLRSISEDKKGNHTTTCYVPRFSPMHRTSSPVDCGMLRAGKLRGICIMSGNEVGLILV